MRLRNYGVNLRELGISPRQLNGLDPKELGLTLKDLGLTLNQLRGLSQYEIEMKKEQAKKKIKEVLDLHKKSV